MNVRRAVAAVLVAAGGVALLAPLAAGAGAKLTWIARGYSSGRGATNWYQVPDGAVAASGYLQYSGSGEVSSPRGTSMNSGAGRVLWVNTGFVAGQQLALGSVTPSVGYPVFFASGSASAADAWGLSYAATTGREYWANDPSGSDNGTLNWVTYSSGGGGTLYGASETFVNDPHSAVADPASGRLYWVNTGDNTIGYANLDGTGGGGTIAAPVSGCRNSGTITLSSVLVDTAGGYLYLGGNALCRTSLTGTSPVLLADLGTDTALGMAVDIVTNRLYWANSTGVMAGDSMKYVDASTAGGTPTTLPGAGSTTTNGAAYPTLAQKVVPTATLSGGTAVGDTLMCTITSLADIPGLNFYREGATPSTYSWTRKVNGVSTPVAGATASQYTPTQFGSYRCSAVVRSITAEGVAAASGWLDQASAPGAPLLPSAVAGPGQAVVSWSAPSSDGGASISTYTATASPGGQQCTATSPATACTVTGLQGGVEYTFTVTATNAAGTSVASASSSPVTPDAPVTPSGGPASEASTGTDASTVVRSTMKLRAPKSATKAGLQVSRGGAVGIPLSCPKTAPVSCDASGVLTMTLPGKVNAEVRFSEMATSRVRELSRFAGVEIGAGSSKLITVRLENKVYSALRKAGIRRVPADLDLSNALEGGDPVTSQQRIWLRLAPMSVAVTG